MDIVTKRTRVLILGAAGRDFHNFNVVFRGNPRYEVVAFTAAQIPNIEGRIYPPELAGPLYPDGIPIWPEQDWGALIAKHRIEQVIFAYSDVPHALVMHKASLALAKGADFRLLGAASTMLRANKPVVSVCAVRTGCGKSPVSRHLAGQLRAEGLRVGVVRHPMPYGNLVTQAVQRFATLDDLVRAECTIEELEEYEPHVRAGQVVFAGVDYERILRLAEGEVDIILWDGGNNDFSFFVPDLEIVLVDPHRPGDERAYFPGEVNLLRAQVLIVTKMDTVDAAQVERVKETIRQENPSALVVESSMPVHLDTPDRVRGASVLVVEDGPTLTHGGMAYGAGLLASRGAGAAAVVDPRPYAVGSIRDTFATYPHTGPVLPAMGYGAAQIRELEDTIGRVPCDVVVIATPVDLRRIMTIAQPTCRVTYAFEERGRPLLAEALAPLIRKAKAHGKQ